MIEQLGDISGRNGLTEQVALSFGTSIGFEICQLPGVFDTLGSGCQAKTLCKAKDRAN